MKLILCFVIISLLSCGTFQPVKIEGEPQECNDTWTFVALANEMSGVFNKDTQLATTALTLVTVTYQRCITARELIKKQKRFDKCVVMIYGDKPQRKQDNYKKYADFSDCLNF